GTPTLTYQWQISRLGIGPWENLDGKTANVLSADKIHLNANKNKYRCIVTNQYGSVISNVADLEVLYNQFLPRTGDNTPILPLTILMLSSGFCGIGLHMKRKQQRHSKA
ncbi:MAG: LPXTG cell wall anchor domain-containing protein, partial [Clostridia bacterium]